MACIAMAQGDLSALLSTRPDLSTLSDLISLTGINRTLSESSNITILTPTNAAFKELLQMNIPEAGGVRDRDIDTVTALLRNHVFRGFYPSNRIGEVPTFAQTFVTPDEQNDIQPFTAITGGQYNGLVKDGSGVKIISGELSISNVTTADIPLGNSIVVHVISSVLMFGPPLQLFLPRGGYTGFAAALAAADNLSLPLGIDDNPAVAAAGITDLTVFIPSNQALWNIGSVIQSINETTLQDILQYHVLTDNIIFSPSFGNRTIATSLDEHNLTTTRTKDGRIFVNEAKVIFGNIVLSNGVAHVIDSVLNPAALFERSQLNFSAPASQRLQFDSASSVSDPLPTAIIPFADELDAPVETPAILASAPLVDVRDRVTVTTTATVAMTNLSSKCRTAATTEHV
ncbi:Putative FAS1 domain-containing protein [Septoria linicola]|uniref:FAS1 domain-containing protein n=1 Tax=Septoria linicola TaxID=215465 RepID=A0A9Q9AIC1_9PEZI|nr:Putative FAS1 domain-containing protein [Septoria linicola]